jgi:hypothetical protein
MSINFHEALEKRCRNVARWQEISEKGIKLARMQGGILLVNEVPRDGYIIRTGDYKVTEYIVRRNGSDLNTPIVVGLAYIGNEELIVRKAMLARAIGLHAEEMFRKPEEIVSSRLMLLFIGEKRKAKEALKALSKEYSLPIIRPKIISS